MNNNTEEDVFFALLKGGLWEIEVRLAPYLPINYESVYALAEEQCVTGLIASGLERVVDSKITNNQAYPFIKRVISLEARNNAMNEFIHSLSVKMEEESIEALLVKGQGIAQCYERPLWRFAGDVDLLLDAQNYDKASAFLSLMASSIDENRPNVKHFAMTIDSWVVELHGTLRSGLGKRVDKVIDAVQEDTFLNAHVRIWKNGGTKILLPAPDNDIIFVFTHILQHFFQGGIGLRQICDWCRLLWTFRDNINYSLLATRLRRMRVMTEWKAFASYAVNYIGMPAHAMPFYDSSACWLRKSKKINSFILEVGNFGHNRDNTIYQKYPRFVYKTISFSRHVLDFFKYLTLFPLDSIRIFWLTMVYGIKAVMSGK